MIKRHLDIMKKRYIDHWRHTLQHSKKLEFYSTFKNDFVPSIYLDITRKSCSLWDMNEIDEIHFLFRCSKYSTIRNAFYNKIVNRIPNVKQLQLTDFIFDLMNCNDNVTLNRLLRLINNSSQPWRGFGYPVLISIDFDDFISRLLP